MNKTFDSIAIDTTNIALNIMTVEELREVIKAAAKKLDERAERHRIAIEEAIADAIEDGFDVSFWVEGTNECCVMCNDDDRVKHISVN
jgi:hypothetical protein